MSWLDRLIGVGAMFDWITPASSILSADIIIAVDRDDQVDALCTYFQVRPGDLITAEPLPLPLPHNIRPDRKKEAD